MKELAGKIKDFLNNNKITLARKNTANEHTSKVGFLCGPCTNFASPKWHERLMRKNTDLKIRVLKSNGKGYMKRGVTQNVLPCMR